MRNKQAHQKLASRLLRQPEYDKYIFSDGTGEIVAQIKGTRFPGLSFDAATKVALTGGIDTSPNQQQPPEIEVKSVHVVE